MCEVPVVLWSRSRLRIVSPGLSSLHQLSAPTGSLLGDPAAHRSVLHTLPAAWMVSPSADCIFVPVVNWNRPAMNHLQRCCDSSCCYFSYVIFFVIGGSVLGSNDI